MHATVDGLNRRTEYEYDDGGFVRKMTRLAGTPDAVATTFTYEPRLHQPATVRDALLHTWTREYDGDGYLTGPVDPLTHRRTVTMSPAGRIIDVTDPLQHVSKL